MDRSAGIILVRMIDQVPHALCLKIYQSFDFPKGQIEKGESDIEAAQRETFEEAGINKIRFPWGFNTVKLMNRGKRQKEVTLFLGITDQEATIKKNPTSGKYEHHGAQWLSLDQAELQLHPYLRPAIAWVKSQLIKQEIG